jgi:hypothetical protein
LKIPVIVVAFVALSGFPSAFSFAQHSIGAQQSVPAAQRESQDARAIEQLLVRSEVTVYVTDGRKKFSRITFTNQEAQFEPPCRLSYQVIGTEASNDGPSRSLTSVDMNFAKVDIAKARLTRYSEVQKPADGLHYTMDGWTVEFIDTAGKPVGTANFSTKSKAKTFVESLTKAVQTCAQPLRGAR